MLARVNARARLPESRAELYGECCSPDGPPFARNKACRTPKGPPFARNNALSSVEALYFIAENACHAPLVALFSRRTRPRTTDLRRTR